MITRPRLVGAICLAALLFVGAYAWLSSHGDWAAQRCDSAFLGGDEGTSPDVQLAGWNWWPPGTKCIVTPKGEVSRAEVLGLFW